MNDRLKLIEEQLETELAQAQAALSKIDEQRRQVATNVERITGSLAALRPARSEATRKRGQSRQPCANKAEVAEIIRRLVEQNGPCPEEDLIGLAEDRLRESGKSLSGFKLRYQAVRKELLAEHPGGRLGLASPITPTAEKSA